MGLLDVIDSFATDDGLGGGQYSVARRTTGTYTNGRYSGPGATTTIVITASVQPISGRDLVVVPEGQRTDESRKIFTATQLVTRTPTTEPDVITIGGEPYAVFRVDGPFRARRRQLVDRLRRASGHAVTQLHTQADTTAIEDAIQSWVTSGSGLPSTNVIWSDQQGPRPPAPYISMRLSEEDQDGLDWYDTEDNFITFAPLSVTAVVGSSLTIAAHGRATGDGPVQFTTSGTLPSACPC